MSSDSYVYFISDGQHVKIGTTRQSPHQRLASLQTGTPKELKLLLTLKGDDRVESYLHKRFTGLHVRGEWFKLRKPIRDFVKRPELPFSVRGKRFTPYRRKKRPGPADPRPVPPMRPISKSADEAIKGRCDEEARRYVSSLLGGPDTWGY